MLEKCTGCGSRILAGAEMYMDRPFCNADCVSRFQISLAEQAVSPDLFEKHVIEVFEAPCPHCGEQGFNDLYNATKITGYLIFYEISSEQKLGCASCGRKHRLGAALHCLFAGWWGIRAALFNLFILPTNLIAALFIRTPMEPSPALRQFVKARLAESIVPQMLQSHPGNVNAEHR